MTFDSKKNQKSSFVTCFFLIFITILKEKDLNTATKVLYISRYFILNTLAFLKLRNRIYVIS